MKGDFIGFSFDGIHCSHLGINHVSSSDRYDEDLFPEIKDKTIEIPNNHGEYYYGSTYGTRTFEIEFAYDSITEMQLRQIRRLFSTSKICELIFDERPYKVYHAKVESPLEMSYVCFDEPKRAPSETEQDGIRIINRIPITEEQTVVVPVIDEETGEPIIDEETGEPMTTEETQTVVVGYNVEKEQIRPWVYEYNTDGSYITERIYKGEGTISLICYYPFAHQLFKELDLYEHAGEQYGNLFTNYTNIDEWAASSGILTRTQREHYHIDEVGNSASSLYTYDIPVYNPGDLNTGFCLYIPFKTVATSMSKTVVISVPPGTSERTVQLSESGTITGITVENVSGITSSINNNVITFINSTESDISVSVSYTYDKDTKQILPKDENPDIIINGDEKVLVLDSIQQKGNDTGILINTTNHLIEGVIFSQIANLHDYRTPSWKTTGNLYNEYIKTGDFPYIKRNDWYLDNVLNQPQCIHIACAETDGISIYYDYLYF